MDFKIFLREAREKQGMSIGKLSQASGVPMSTIFNYEIGVMPTLDKADKLLRALGLTMTLGERKEGS